MVRDEFARGRQTNAARSSDHEARAELGFQLGDVFRDGRLADHELLRCRRERSPARQGSERTQASLELHSTASYSSDMNYVLEF